MTLLRHRTPLAWMVATAFAAGAGVGFGCSHSDLDRIIRPRTFRDDKLDVSGRLCTRAPDSRTLPLRIVFVVDRSDSMQTTDPPDPITMETGRERAVRETWQSLLMTGAQGVRFSIIGFDASTQALTQEDYNGDGLADSYFTADPVKLMSATRSLSNSASNTNYAAALAEAYNVIRTEILISDQAALPLSRYIVIFVSDGLPDVDVTDMRAAAANQRAALLANIDDLTDLAQLYRIGQFEVDTVFMSAGLGVASLDVQAQDTLEAMARRTRGKFRSFLAGEALNFLFVDFTFLRRVFTLKSLTAINMNVVTDVSQIGEWAVPVDGGVPLRDAGGPRDSGMPPDAGMPVDAAADAAPDVRDTGVDTGDSGPRAGYEFTDITHDGIPTCGEPLADSDGDGLSDLRELRIASDPLVPDSDDDGLTDRLEWRLASSGFSPTNPTDALCYTPRQCVDVNMDTWCDCVDIDDNGPGMPAGNGICDCAEGKAEPCITPLPYPVAPIYMTPPPGLDCVDLDIDGYCDCPDRNGDHLCDYGDRDQDGLHDCEEIYYGTASNGQDSDADGLPDFIEIHAGANPVVDDRTQDLDLDQTTNGTEVVAAADPWCDDAIVRSHVAYQTTADSEGIADGATCYSFRVGNITLVPTLPNEGAAYPGNGWNRVYFYAGEVAFDDPDAFASFRIACVMAMYDPNGGYKNPPSGRVELSPEDFHDVHTFEPNRDCVWP